MEFHVYPRQAIESLQAVSERLSQIDPASVLDWDEPSQRLSLSASIDFEHLLAVLRDTGLSLLPQDIRPIPAVCCGGCGG